MSSEAAFRTLDPILRMLLSSIESYRDACTSDITPNEERILGILRVQVRILENLDQALEQVEDTYGSGVLQVQLDYILLPLRLVLQSSEWQQENVSPIRQSAIWKSTETAARVMSYTVDRIGSLMSMKQRVDCLVACIFPLPGLVGTDDADNIRLDRGDDCTNAILNCIIKLLETADKVKSDEGDDVSVAVEANLVARISFCCTTLLSRSSRKDSPEVQLQALNTLDTFMKVISDQEMWQSYFPGVFAALCGLLLSESRLTPAQASPKVASSACRTLSDLLCVTLSSPSIKQEQTEDTLNAWKHVQELAESSSTEQTGNSNAFLEEVHSRLPAVLILLLNLFPTASSPKLRMAAPNLCHVILVETCPVWEREESSHVLQAAIECCIALSRDKDERVVSLAKSTIVDYQRDSGRHQVDSSIGPRLLQLIGELPALAKSGREMELRGRINTISGYLLLGGSLRSSLTSVAKEIRTSLAVLFDVDFDSIQFAPRVETMDAWDVWQPDQCRFRFMRDETAKSAREMVHALGSTLGEKSASSFVDACVADVLEACIASTHSLSGSRQVEWLHEWIGCTVVANEILTGAFEAPTTESSIESEVSKAKSSRHDRKRLKRLHSLAGAILPVLTSAPLWTLDTAVVDDQDQKPSKSKAAVSLTITEVQDDSEVAVQSVSASALKGNAAIVCSLIGLVNETVELLGKDTDSFLQVILFPLCEKASSQNHSQVQRTASVALQQVATACELSSTRELIRGNFDYLFGAMLSRIRRPSGQRPGIACTSFPIFIPRIVKAVLQSATDSCATTGAVRSVRPIADESCVSYVIELVNALVSSFDSNLTIINKNPILQASIAVSLVEVFDAALAFIASTFGFNLEKKKDSFADAIIPKEGVNCMAVLEPFRLLQPDGLTAKEGFEKMRKQAGNESEAGAQESDRPVVTITDGELDLINLALERCSFFLSSPSLQVQMASCDGMQHAFMLLGEVAKHTERNEDEPNGPKTAVLRHISTSWPSIISRFRVLSSTIITSTRGKAVSIRTLQSANPTISQDVSTQIIFLSKLFELIASMCEVSEDFLVSEIKKHVWPVTAELLGLYVQDGTPTPQNQLSYNGIVPRATIRPKALVTERDKLLFSILDFMTRIFGEPQCGRGISDLIPAAGTILLPFLAHEGELQTRTMRALKTMMLIDCDALWRPLLQLSKKPLPSRPFGPENEAAVVVNNNRDKRTPLELAADELIEYIESLPEQDLGITER